MRAETKSSLFLVQEKTTESPDRNAYGEPLTTWAEEKRFWGKIMPITGRESFVANTRQVEVSHRIWADYWDVDGITEAMRIVFSPTGNYDASTDWIYFDIAAVMHDHLSRGDSEIRVIQKRAQTV